MLISLYWMRYVQVWMQLPKLQQIWKYTESVKSRRIGGYVSVKSELQHPPLASPGHLTFLKIIVQIPPYPGQNAVQMPHSRVHSGDQMPPPWGHFIG